MPHDFATKPTLTGDRVVLRRFTEGDLPAVVEILNDPEVGRLTGSYATSAEPRAAATTLDEPLRDFYLRNVTATDRLDLAVVDREREEVVGEAVLNEYDEAAAACNFRILIGPRGRDRGLGTETTRLITDYGLDMIGLHRISLGVRAFNPRAQRTYERASPYRCSSLWLCW